MFYSQHVLTKKGPLAKIWLAAHMQTKLTKAMVFSTDVRKAVDSIITPEVPMALRLTSNLLLGVVRILHRKTKYLLQESSDAMTRLKLTFRPGSTVDLPRENTTANFNATTLHPTHLDSLDAPNIDLDLLPSRPQTKPSGAFLAADADITIDEFAGGLAGGMLDAFALEPELTRDAELELGAEPLLFTPSQRLSERDPTSSSVRSGPSVEVLRASDGQHTPVAPQLSVERAPAPEDGDGELNVPGSVRTPASVMATPPAKSPSAMFDMNTDGTADRNIGVGLETPELPSMSVGAQELVLAEEGEQPQVVVPPSAVDTPNVPFVEGGPSVPEEQPLSEQLGTGELVTRKELPSEQLTEAEEEARQEQQTQTQTEAGTQEDMQTQDTRRRSRKRKAVVLTDEGETELSATAFRACLMDTSDLIRRPGSRRRVTVPQLRYEDLLGRPAIQLAPALQGVFAASFRIDELVIASPISDADMGERGEEADISGGGVSRGTSENDAEKTVEKGVIADPDAGIGMQDVVEEIDETRRITSDTLVPIEDDDEMPLPPTELFDEQLLDRDDISNDIIHDSTAVPTLRDVATTRAQVDANDDDAAVTEQTVSARTRKMQELLVSRGNEDGEVDFSELLRIEKADRRIAARCFYEILNLGSRRAVLLRQDQAYGRISVRPYVDES